MEATKRPWARSGSIIYDVETGKAVCIIFDKSLTSIAWEESEVVRDAIGDQIVTERNTFDQAREALKDTIKVAEVGLRLAGNDEEFIAIRLKKSKDVLAAMEAEPA